ncbi:MULTISPECIES: C40 family peptidase [Kitasatospora]|uniref:Putative peptidase C40 family protein n=1 Tax=Kitasatospora setae (strain ATCC 33774 / DSM 43861 / JCM 3304 / KCC A-0304 / NBRC 14216 / KM-6054) TaxID=452652 RepID=E4N9W8_KITSK|nr:MULTISPECIES: C40 family peptidase [Kitasatospora]BAJ27999.1 putative peptidase C40 family protein [Kitasatospora setae KM-6054]
MASHRRPKQPSRARISVFTAAAATAVALTAQAGAHAAPAQPNKDEVKAQVDKLLEEQEQAAEKFNGAKERSDQLRKQADDLQDQVARGQEQLTELSSGLAAVAGDQYRQGGVDPSMQLMLSSNPDKYLAQAASFDQAASTQAETLKSLKEQQRRLDQQKQEAAQVLHELDTQTQALNDAKSEVNGKLAEAQKLLAKLSAADRAAILRDTGGTASRSSNRVDPASLPQASGYAATAVAAALGKQGSAYVWGATGPNTFDCSGLMVWAYAKAGVSLPRTSQSQGSYGVNVGTDWHNAQPGDLVVYYGDRHHVGMYIGDGMVVHAPRTGDVVKVMKVDTLPISTIRRV